MGVQRPGSRRSPSPVRNADIAVVAIGGLLHKVDPARTSNEEPRTIRMRSKPRPSRPPANVEYSRRKAHLSRLHQFPALERLIEAPKRVVIDHSLESAGTCG
jgi:hypothetical protein